MNQELLEKYLNNNCTAQEVEEVILWMRHQNFHSESREFSKVDWQHHRTMTNLISEEKLETLLDKVHHKINTEDDYSIHQKNRFYDWILKAAAILLIPVLVFLTYSISDNRKLYNQAKMVSIDSLEVIAPVGSRTVIELSDGTIAHLNYGSRIKYPHNFGGETREVLLTGEGYFEVTHNPDKPFIVNAGGLKVKAVGTSFNVNAYSENNSVAITLLEGKVLLENQVTEVNPIQTMEPGQHIIYNKESNKIIIDAGKTDKYISWKDGKLVFENENIEEIARRLSRIFNVEIQVADEVKNYRYTVTFIDEPLFQILELLSIATPIEFKALPRTKNIDGTFSKQKLLIVKKKFS